MTIQESAADVAARITKARKIAGRSSIWLAEKSGIAEKTLTRRFAAPERFTLAELSAIARALDRELEDFLTERRDELAVVA